MGTLSHHHVVGPLTRYGLLAAVATALVDQLVKLWLLFGLNLPANAPVHLTPFLDLVMAWNTGISYGLFQHQGPLGQGILLAVKAIAVALLVLWLARARTQTAAVSLGLIIGGAIGNGIDRLIYGAVADFVLFHAEIAGWSFKWYVFNLADTAIVVGVAGLLYDSFHKESAAKAP
jgi:signal peptidase II